MNVLLYEALIICLGMYNLYSHSVLLINGGLAVCMSQKMVALVTERLTLGPCCGFVDFLPNKHTEDYFLFGFLTCILHHRVLCLVLFMQVYINNTLYKTIKAAYLIEI